uniref:Uncharacterized protein n=1 Tax=Knipowitschia caucasica TaxID=637954 RepID=A0AAV2L7L7_KNICA
MHMVFLGIGGCRCFRRTFEGSAPRYKVKVRRSMVLSHPAYDLTSREHPEALEQHSLQRHKTREPQRRTLLSALQPELDFVWTGPKLQSETLDSLDLRTSPQCKTLDSLDLRTKPQSETPDSLDLQTSAQDVTIGNKRVMIPQFS